MSAIWQSEPCASSLGAVRGRRLQIHAHRQPSANALPWLVVAKESLEIQGVERCASSVSPPCGETPPRELNLRLLDGFCPHLLFGFRDTEEYFHQRQTPGNETIFRDYVGGEPNT
jgi:hypothetical protein